MSAMFQLSFMLALCNQFLLGAAVSTHNNRCFPGMSCFPRTQEVSELYEAVGGRLIFPYQKEYDSVVMMKNTHQTKFPYAIVVANSTTDVQKAVVFARKYNLKVTIQVDKYNRVIVGGSCHTVAMGGYTQGGGQSPMSRMFGLAIDNLLEIEMVTANGSVIIADEHETRFMNDDGSFTITNDTDIFWAVRGGGGGTWGVITKFTFKLHPAAPFVQMICEYKHTLANGTMVADPIYHKLFGFIENRLPREWGGYIITHANDQRPDGSNGSILLFFNHYGGWDTSTRRVLDEMYNYQKDWQRTCNYVNHSSFLEYEKTAVDALYYSIFLTNILMSNFSDENIQGFLTSTTTPLKDGLTSYTTGTLIGGKVMDIGDSETAIQPGFRHSLVSMTTSYAINGDGTYDSYYFNERRKLNDRLRKIGNGMFRNEGSSDTPFWKDDFWGSNYPRLEKIKRQWDPDNFFTCVDCVGNDM